MANLTITPANVQRGDNTQTKDGTAGEAITAGQVVYLNSTTKRWGLADNNFGTAEVRTAFGIALNSASIGQPVEVQIAGSIVIGATVVVGTSYWLSDTPGAISIQADQTTGEYVTLIGVATSSTVIALDISNVGVAVA